MSSLNSKNFFEAGASSATKNTDLSDGIHEDVSSDLSREHGPGGKKQPYSLGGVAGTEMGTAGGVLDNLAGSPHVLGSDAQRLGENSFAAGASSATKSTDLGEGIYEDVSASKGPGQHLGGMSADGLGGRGAGSYTSGASTSTSNSGMSLLDRAKESISGLVGKDSASQGMEQGSAGAMKNTDLSGGIHEDAPDAKSSVKSALTSLSK